MHKTGPIQGQAGQGIVKYALILMRVAMVVLLGLFMFGPAVANMLRDVTLSLGNSTPAPPGNTPVPGSTNIPTSTALPAVTATPITGIILAASAQRTGGGNGNALNVTITVSSATTLSLIDSAGATRVANAACSGTCVIHVPSIGSSAGYIVWYPPKG
jgi:hypothetical protein